MPPTVTLTTMVYAGVGLPIAKVMDPLPSAPVVPGNVELIVLYLAVIEIGTFGNDD